MTGRCSVLPIHLHDIADWFSLIIVLTGSLCLTVRARGFSYWNWVFCWWLFLPFVAGFATFLLSGFRGLFARDGISYQTHRCTLRMGFWEEWGRACWTVTGTVERQQTSRTFARKTAGPFGSFFGEWHRVWPRHCPSLARRVKTENAGPVGTLKANYSVNIVPLFWWHFWGTIFCCRMFFYLMGCYCPLRGYLQIMTIDKWY